MISPAIPYEGDKPYIFLSYCHKDRALVYPLLEQLVRDGYRVWYDEGNAPGDNWVETIAEHLLGCHVYLAMITRNFADSHSCRSELNMAFSNDKRVLPLLLEEVHFSPGMKLLLSVTHYLQLGDYPNGDALLAKVYRQEEMAACLEGPGKLPLREIPEKAPGKASDSTHRETKAPRKASDEEKTVLLGHGKSGEKPEDKDETVLIPDGHDAEDGDVTVLDEDRERTILDDDAGKTVSEEDEDEERTQLGAPPQNRTVLVRLAKGSVFLSREPEISIGRSDRKSNYVITDNDRISSHHADLIVHGGRCSIQDCKSLNGTFLGTAQLEPGTPAPLENPGLFRLYNEEFLVAHGAMAENILSRGTLALLKNPASGGIRLLEEQPFLLGRHNRWPDGITMSEKDMKVGREHARILWKQGSYLLEALKSVNGTRHNGQLLEQGATVALKNGDRIRVGDTTLEFTLLSLTGV